LLEAVIASEQVQFERFLLFGIELIEFECV
jgi:hypothetical protein